MIHGPGRISNGECSKNCQHYAAHPVQRYIKKYEMYMPHPDYPLVDASSRGKNGPIKIGYNNFVSEPSRAFIKSSVNVGIPFNPDFNGPHGTMGVNRVRVIFFQPGCC